MAIKVSFVIPVHNVEHYIEECVQSILKQNITDIEIILVDDGSVDGSLSVCRKLAHQYSNIRVIQQESSGVSAARNNGAKSAAGKYICFIDADDFYISDFALDFYEKCEKNSLDIIRGIYSVYDEEKDICLHINRKSLTYYGKVLSGSDFLLHSIKEKANEVVPWLGFFRRSFLIENDITFPEGIGYEEDQVYFLKALLQKNCRVMQSDADFYAYRRRAGSATKTPTLKQAEDVIYVVNAERRLAERITDRKIRKYAKKYISSSFYQLTSIYGRVPKPDKKKIISICRFNIKLMCVIYASNLHQRIKIFMFTFMPHIVSLIYELRK